MLARKSGSLAAEAWAVGLLLRRGANKGSVVYLGLACPHPLQAPSLH